MDRGLKSTFQAQLEMLRKASLFSITSNISEMKNEIFVVSKKTSERVICHMPNHSNVSKTLRYLAWLSIDHVQATQEAKDIVKFLNTLERHLRLLAEQPLDSLKAFRSIQEALSPLMESLRLVWVLSSYYSQDDTMGKLLQEIGIQIGNFHQLFLT